jgi:aspartyl-tRNA(Asn)/glutamyl-tRNA(Gln) amidotransferase subunit C
VGIDREEVEHIASLARLELTEEEKVRFTEQLPEIVRYFEKLQELNVEGVEPTCHVEKMTNRLRSDSEERSLLLEETLRNAPESEANQFRVPLAMKDIGSVS